MRMRSLGVAFGLVAAVAACSKDNLNIANPNVVTVESAQGDPASIQLLATGLLADLRGLVTGAPMPLGILGRESYNLTPTEGRNTTGYLIGISVAGVQKLDPSGFATGLWGPGFNARRDALNYYKAVEASALTAAQKSAARGFARTIEAFAMMQVIGTRDTLGAPIEILEDFTAVAPFVTRDSVYKWILATFDAGATNLAAGGTAFPFTLHTGFAGFNTPATFAQFNRALKARAAAWYATSGGGTGAWQQALTALQGSFLNATATTRAQFDVGVYQIFSTAAGDATNGLSTATNSNFYAHMSFQQNAELKADGSPDNRMTAKHRGGLPSRAGLQTADGPVSQPTTNGYNIWPTSTTNMATIRNEELILLRAEARLGTGDKAGAIADLNQVRQNSGGLPASTLTAASSDDAVITGILYEKRYSLAMEAQRWIDMRRYNKLNLLPIDIPSGPNKNFVARVMPIPQGECNARNLAAAAGSATGILGPGSSNSCAP